MVKAAAAGRLHLAGIALALWACAAQQQLAQAPSLSPGLAVTLYDFVHGDTHGMTFVYNSGPHSTADDPLLSVCGSWGYAGATMMGTVAQSNRGSERNAVQLQRHNESVQQQVEWYFCDGVAVLGIRNYPLHDGHNMSRGTFQYMSDAGEWVTIQAAQLVNTSTGKGLNMSSDGTIFAQRWRIHDWRCNGNQRMDGIDLVVKEAGSPYRRCVGDEMPDVPHRLRLRRAQTAGSGGSVVVVAPTTTAPDDSSDAVGVVAGPGNTLGTIAPTTAPGNISSVVDVVAGPGDSLATLAPTTAPDESSAVASWYCGDAEWCSCCWDHNWYQQASGYPQYVRDDSANNSCSHGIRCLQNTDFGNLTFCRGFERFACDANHPHIDNNGFRSTTVYWACDGCDCCDLADGIAVSTTLYAVRQELYGVAAEMGYDGDPTLGAVIPRECPAPAASVGDLVDDTQEVEQILVDAVLVEGNTGAIIGPFTTDSGAAAAKWITSDQANLAGYVDVNASGFAPAVAIPTGLFVNESADLVVVLAEIRRAEFDGLSGLDDSSELALPAVSVSLYLAQGGVNTPLDLTNVDPPILVRISNQSAHPSAVCAYLSGGTWVTQGLARDPTRPDEFWCTTNHLTIFGALLQEFQTILLECTNVMALSGDGLREISARGGWWYRAPAVLLWMLLMSLAATFGYALRMDDKMRRSGIWNDEHFLIDLPVNWDRSCRQQVRAAAESCRDLGRKFSGYFSARSAPPKAEGDQGGDDKTAARKNPFHTIAENLVAVIIIFNLSIRSRLSPMTVKNHVYDNSGFIQGGFAVKSSGELRKTVDSLRDEAPCIFHENFYSLGFCQRVWAHFRILHPLTDLMKIDLEMSASKRAKLLIDRFLGAMFISMLIFSVDGTAITANSPSDCPMTRQSIGWYLFVVLLSIFFNGGPQLIAVFFVSRAPAPRNGGDPATVEQRLFWWKIRDIVFWTCGAVYTVFHVVFIFAFLANLGARDEWKWVATFLLTVFWVLLSRPLIASLALSLGVSLVKWHYPGLLENPPPKLGIDLEGLNDREDDPLAEMPEKARDKVKELGNRGITVAQLLDFYEKLPMHMPFFDPMVSTTHDVVRHAIIPLTAKLVHTEVADSPDASPQAWGNGAVKDERDPGDLSLQIPAQEPSGGAAGAGGKIPGKKKNKMWTACLDCGGAESPQERLQSREDIIKPEDAPGPAVAVDEEEEDEAPCNPRSVLSTKHGVAYATLVSDGQPQIANKMVTHNWGNKFAHLVAAVLADALGHSTFEEIEALLAAGKVAELRAQAEARGSSSDTYWICALSVNQHAGICAQTPFEGYQGTPWVACDCTTEKHFAGELSEMNKFDEMMAYLKKTHRDNNNSISKRSGSGGAVRRFGQVVAVDKEFQMFTRVWCIAELLQAYKSHLPQALKVHSGASTAEYRDVIENIDISKANASFESDKEFVMAKVTDLKTFNKQVRQLLIQRFSALSEIADFATSTEIVLRTTLLILWQTALFN